MSPSQQEQQRGPEHELHGEAVVVSGMSGLFPASNSVHEFSQILYSKTNPVNNENLRWSLKHPQASEYTGKVAGLEHFDAQFFKVHARLANCMDPMARKLLEHSFQAIYDAGYNPKHFDGKNVGVYIGAAFSETESLVLYECENKSNIYNLTGMSRTMYANRISYWLNAKGPSLIIDDACCGSVVALEEAYHAMNGGKIEAAIVAGANLCIAPHTQVHSSRCFKTSPDDKTRSFDQDAAGCVKSEAISILFLQKAKDAVRVYAEIINVKNEFASWKTRHAYSNFGFVRDPIATSEFLNKFYSESCVLPKCVEYIEACGTATPDADKAELQAIEKVFCGKRSDSVLVGSVMSNIGYTGAASGVTAITKVLLGYHHGVMATNLHCERPRQDIPAIQDGRLCVLTDHRPFRGTYAAVNCLSYAGVNSHVLLRGCNKLKDLARYKCTIPRLVTVSARQKEHLNDLFNDLKSRQIDAEELALLQNIHSTNVAGHLGRGFIILDSDETQKTVSLAESMEHYDEVRRPLWFVYSGMGSQWAGMGAQLMRIPVFAAAIERCSKVLEPRGLDLVHIITSTDKTIFENILHAFVGIAAIQIGITDILTALKLEPDNIIGHSVGELGCAYADGCLTAEEMILSAASRGESSNNVVVIRGAMAAVGLGYNELSKICPSNIDIACHNSATSCTISGPEEAVSDFVTNLTDRGIFAKEVACANIAYHSRYIQNAGPYLMTFMTEIIKKPKLRSKRWLSTSVPQERWNEPSAKFCSAAYLTNNLLNPVLFEETSRLIPSDAVLVEIAPHGLLQAILKRALPDSCRNIPLTLRGDPDNARFLLNAIGKLYIEGFNPQVQALYPKVEFPVSTRTPHLGHLVKWNHSDKCTTWSIGDIENKSTSCRKININIHDEEHHHLTGNIVRGKMLYPFAGALVAVWDTLAMILGYPKKKLSVTFRDVHLYSQPIIQDQKQLNILVSIHRGSGYFEVLEEDSKVATGHINVLYKEKSVHVAKSEKKCFIDSSEVYEHLSSRGYFYKENFRSIAGVDESVTSAQIVWNDNWVTFIDGLFQLNTLRCLHEDVSQISRIGKLCINVNQHEEAVMENKSKSDTAMLTAVLIDTLGSTRCGGILLNNLIFHNLPLTSQNIFKLSIPNSNAINVDFMEQEIISKHKKFVLKISNVGDLDSLHWEEAPIDPYDSTQVLVHYAGLNVLDSKKATGVTPFEDSNKCFGMDFSGVTKSGSRVMGVVRNGAASTVVTARPDLLWPVPPNWTMEDAATVPLAYAQAFYYLCVKSNLQRGWNVLIHGGAGALGQAAISIALAHGCKVFTTVSNAAKKAFLLELFPELSDKSIGNSRDDSFGDMVLNATKGSGCEIVMSCVHNDLKNISLKCAAFNGITFDMHHIKDRDEFEYGMFYMTKQRAYIATDFCSILESQETTDLKTIQSLVCEGISRGYVRPLTRVWFAADEAARAFRLLAASRHRGRALLQLWNSPTLASPRITCSLNKAQLIVWDGSMFGFQLTDRLIARGARKLFIYNLNPSLRHSLKLRLWRKIGVEVEIFHTQINKGDISFKTLNNIITRENIEGVYVSVTNIEKKQSDNVESIIKNLDIFFRKMDPPLKYFAVICGSSDLIGMNTVLSRSKDGFPATILNLPDRHEEQKTYSDMMEESIWNRNALNVTEIALRSKHPVLCVQKQEVKKISLMGMISSLTGEKLSFENSPDGTTLEDLGLKEYLPAVRFFLNTVHHVSFDDKYVMKLTKTRIMEIENNLAARKFEDVKGLQGFFSVEHMNELEATSDWIPMTTLVYNVEMMEGAIDVSRTHLFIVPGLEGLHSRFSALCEHLKLPAVVLQPGYDQPKDTPQLLAHRYAKILQEEFKLKNNFYLLGYEFGIIVALELAAILEDQGLTGTVFCIGDGPDELRVLLESELRTFDSEASLQEGICRHIHLLMTQDTPTSLDSALRNCSSWHERVEACMRLLLGRVPQTAQYIRSLLEAVYVRICVARTAVANPRALRSRLVLLHARCEPGLLHTECSLQRYSQHTLHVKELTAPMSHATVDLLVPAVVNQYLHQDLQEFENTNICSSCD